MVQAGNSITVGNNNKSKNDIVTIENTTTKDCQHYHYHRYAMKALFRIACRISKKAKKCVCRSAAPSVTSQQEQTDCEHTYSRSSRSSSKRRNGANNEKKNSGFGYVKFTESSSSTETLDDQSHMTNTTTASTDATTVASNNSKNISAIKSTKLMVHIKENSPVDILTTTKTNEENTLSSTDQTIIGTITKTTTTTTKKLCTENGKQQVNEYLKRPRRNAIFVTTDEERAGLKLVLRYYIQAQSIKQYLM